MSCHICGLDAYAFKKQWEPEIKPEMRVLVDSINKVTSGGIRSRSSKLDRTRLGKEMNSLVIT